MTAEQLEERLKDLLEMGAINSRVVLTGEEVASIARRVIAAEKLVEALDAVRGMVTQDVGKQIEAETKLDASITAYREASK